MDNIICVIIQCEDVRRLDKISFKVSTSKKEIIVDVKDYIKLYNKEKIKNFELENEISKNLDMSNIYYHEDNKRYNLIFTIRHQSSTPSTMIISLNDKHNDIFNMFCFESYSFCSHLMKFTNENNKNKVEQILGESYKNYYNKFDILEGFKKVNPKENNNKDYKKKHKKYIEGIEKKYLNI